MISRRRILLAAGSALLQVSAARAAQPANSVFRVGHLSGSSAAGSKLFVDSFREGMRALGLIDGRNWSLTERYAHGNTGRLADLAQQLIKENPDLLLVSTTPANVAAKAATVAIRIPIVMVLVADPVGAGLVANLARPGGNITGITNIAAELAGKRLEIIKEIVKWTP